MKVSELIGKIHIAYKGGAASDAPLASDPKYSVYLSIANDNQDRWAEDPDHDWPSLFAGDEELSIVAGTITLSPDVCRPTSPIVYGDIQVPVVNFKERHNLNVGAYVSGPKGARVVHFINPEDYTGTAKVGILNYPVAMTTGTDDVTCDNTRWLAYQTAAMLARNDPAKEDEADMLFSLANNEYAEMAGRDMKDKKGSGRKMRVVYPRIPGL